MSIKRCQSYRVTLTCSINESSELGHAISSPSLLRLGSNAWRQKLLKNCHGINSLNPLKFRLEIPNDSKECSDFSSLRIFSIP